MSLPAPRLKLMVLKKFQTVLDWHRREMESIKTKLRYEMNGYAKKQEIMKSLQIKLQNH